MIDSFRLQSLGSFQQEKYNELSTLVKVISPHRQWDIYGWLVVLASSESTFACTRTRYVYLIPHPFRCRRFGLPAVRQRFLMCFGWLFPVGVRSLLTFFQMSLLSVFRFHRIVCYFAYQVHTRSTSAHHVLSAQKVRKVFDESTPAPASARTG